VEGFPAGLRRAVVVPRLPGRVVFCAALVVAARLRAGALAARRFVAAAVPDALRVAVPAAVRRVVAVLAALARAGAARLVLAGLRVVVRFAGAAFRVTAA